MKIADIDKLKKACPSLETRKEKWDRLAPKLGYIRPITDDRRWRAELDAEKRTLTFYRDDENGKWTYDDVLKFGGWDE